jgi:hypothetical protein
MAEAKMQLYRLRRGPGEKGKQGAGNGENNGLREQGTRSEKRVTRSGFRGTNGFRVSGFGFRANCLRAAVVAQERGSAKSARSALRVARTSNEKREAGDEKREGRRL